MKTRKILVILLFYLSGIGCIAQQQTEKTKLPLLIKNSVTSFYVGETHVSVEKFYRKGKVETGVVIIYPFEPYKNFVGNLIYDVGEHIVSSAYNKGFALRVQYKFNLPENNRKKVYYLSPLIMYKHTRKNKVWVHYKDYEESEYDTDYSALESDKTDIYALEFLAGRTYFFPSVVSVDIYCGVGIRLYNFHDVNVYAYDVEKVAEHEGIGKKEGFADLLPSIHIGMKIGINIVK